jgi:hypothetical protein
MPASSEKGTITVLKKYFYNKSEIRRIGQLKQKPSKYNMIPEPALLSLVVVDFPLKTLSVLVQIIKIFALSLNIVVNVTYVPAYATFCLIDVAGLSDSIAPESKTARIKILNSLIMESEVFKNSHRDAHILATSNGMAIIYLQQLPKVALDLAIDVHRKLGLHNQGKDQQDAITVRIGIDYNRVLPGKDLKNDGDLWGSGIIVARKVMDLGVGNHILATERAAEKLLELEGAKNILHPAGHYNIMRTKVMIYSIHGEGFGNPTPLMAETETIEAEKIEQKVVLELDERNPMVRHIYNYLEELNATGSPLLSSTKWSIVSRKQRFSLDDMAVTAWDREGELRCYVERDELNAKDLRFLFRRSLDPGERASYWWKYRVMNAKTTWTTSIPQDTYRFQLKFKYPVKMKPRPVPVLQDISNPMQTCVIPQSAMETDDSHVTITWSKWTPLVEMVRLDW